jgi:hypothetical protein
MERLLTYGLIDNQLRHVSEVQNGLDCGCVCANCKHPLIAKNNPANRKVAHFAHQSGRECSAAFETTLHLLAKSILQKTKRLKLPKYHYDYDQFNNESVFRESVDLAFDNIILEKSIEFNGGRIIPDAIGEIQTKQIFIEFANTHFVDPDKKNKLKAIRVACIEIDLSDQPLDEVQLTEFFNSDSTFKYWILNPKLDKEYLNHKKKLLEEERLRQRQLLLEEQRRIEKDKSKYILYKKSDVYAVLQRKDNTVANCPLKQDALNEFKSSKFYRHKVLKRIIDGEYWNGQLYGYQQNGKWIFIKQEKVIIYPPDEKRNSLTEQENRENNVLYAGLKRIQEVLKNPSFGACRNCEFSVERLSVDGFNYQVCKHPIR